MSSTTPITTTKSSAVSTTTKSTATPEQKQATEQELTAIFRSRTNELQQLVNKVGELEREAEEHALVIETLKDAHATEPTRKCFRLVGGILVERTVDDVLPELLERYDSIKAILETLKAQYLKKDSDFESWQRENNIVVKQR